RGEGIIGRKLPQSETRLVRSLTLLCALTLSLSVVASADDATSKEPKTKLKSAKLPDTRNVHVAGPIYLAGQPSKAALKELADRGVKTIISLRHPDEERWDEKQACEELGLQFHRYQISSPSDINKKLVDSIRKYLVAAKKDSGVLLHCASANRVGAIWLAHRVKDAGLTLAEATAEAKEVGLVAPQLKTQAIKYLDE
ncbi:MAG: hypothetical protein AAFU85_33980, partial [Planctomycetota bacterium]